MATLEDVATVDGAGVELPLVVTVGDPTAVVEATTVAGMVDTTVAL